MKALNDCLQDQLVYLSSEIFNMYKNLSNNYVLSSRHRSVLKTMKMAYESIDEMIQEEKDESINRND